MTNSKKKKVTLKLPDMGARTGPPAAVEKPTTPDTQEPQRPMQSQPQPPSAQSLESWSAEGGPEPSVKQTASGATKRRKANRPKDARPFERVTIHLDPELADKLRISCAIKRQSLSDAVSTALEATLSKEQS